VLASLIRNDPHPRSEKDAGWVMGVIRSVIDLKWYFTFEDLKPADVDKVGRQGGRD